MELQVTQENLAKALGNVGRVASSKTGLQILDNILLRTNSNKLMLAATNLEIATTQQIGAKITKQGSITVPAKLLTDFVQNLPKGTLTLSTKQQTLHISSDTNQSSINGTSDEEFPELPVIDEKKSLQYELSAADFKEASTQTIVAASSDSTRPVLTGVYWHTFNDSLYFAATDGYRLAEKRVMKASTQLEAIIPTTTVQEVLRTLSDDTESIEVLFDETQVRFRIDASEITSRLIDGVFPDYRQLIPSSSSTSFAIEKSNLQQATKLAALFSRGSAGSVQIKVDTDSSKAHISSVASEYGENNTDIPVEITGESGAIALNSRYLLEALSVIEGNELVLGFSGPLAPSQLHTSKKDPDYKHIIMPIKS